MGMKVFYCLLRLCKGLMRREDGAARPSGGSGAGGQAMVEYIIVAGVLVASVAVLSVFLYTFREQSGRVLDLVAWDYP